jgi:hypothetical protein
MQEGVLEEEHTITNSKEAFLFQTLHVIVLYFANNDFLIPVTWDYHCSRTILKHVQKRKEKFKYDVIPSSKVCVI